jgi:SeqA protein N-terminal domain
MIALSMKSIRIDRDIVEYLSSKAIAPDESLSSILRRELGQVTVEIDDDVYSVLTSRAVEVGEPASQILRRELGLDAAPSPGPDVVEFHVPAGTGNGAWNSPAQAVTAHVGDVLRIVNDDAVPHRLHTDGVPFRHPTADIPPSQSADYVLQAPLQPGDGHVLYDHDSGPAASFSLVVLPA